MNYVSEQNIDNIVKGLSNKIAMSVSNGTLIGDTTPVGTIISFMGIQAPLYYLACDGTTYNIVDYVELANFIEAQFGSKNYFGGNGTTTFAVPDLRGEFLRGTGTNSHENQGSGANVGVHQDGTVTFDFTLNPNDLGQIFGSDVTKSAKNKDYAYTTRAYNNMGTYSQSTAPDDYSGSYTSRPTNTSVLYCIKYTKAVIPSEYEDGTPIGRVVFDCILRDGYIKANGAQIEDATIAIPRLLSFVQKYSSQILAPDQATYDANVGLYMYDSNNDILTLPNYIGRFMEGGNSVESVEAGLPNIKGNSGTWRTGMTTSNDFPVGAGALNGLLAEENYEISPSPFTGRNMIASLTFDASKSNAIYSDSVTTVQPPAIKMIPQIRY